jgi:transposase-like protein
LNVLPKDENEKKEKKKFKEYNIGYVHIDISEVHTKEGKAYMFVAIDRATKYTYVEIYERMTTDNACLFLRNFIKDCCFKITKILTDNGAQFTYKLLAEHLQPKNKIHPFDEVCNEYNIEHRLTKFRHPWTNGQVEIMNKIIKSHTTKKYYYKSLKELKEHIFSFLMFYNFQRKLKSLKYQSPYDIILKIYSQDILFFNENPIHKKVGLNIF